MPIAAAAGAVDELAFGIIAIVILLAIATFVINPLRTASSVVSPLPVIGGAIAWVLWRVADMVQIVIDSAQWMIDAGRNDALAAWNWLHYWTFVYEFGWIINSVQWVQANYGVLNSIIAWWASIWWQAFVTLPNLVAGLLNDVGGLHAWLDGTLLPRIAGIEAGIRELSGFIQGYVIDRINAIANDVNAIRSWLESPYGLARQIADSEARADSYARSLAVPLTAAIAQIENSPCMKVCEPLGGIGQLLQGLEDAGMLAILLALVAETQHDPIAVQRTLRDIVVPIVTDAASSIGL